MRTETVTVTPAKAREWLEKNVHNRNVHTSAVSLLARDMKRGNWALTGEAVKFNRRGELLDGQHRLLACIQADVPFETLVAYDVDSEAQDVMDTGARRNPADALSLRGYRYSVTLAAIARLAMRYRQSSPGGPAHLPQIYATNSDVLDYVEAHPRLVEAAEKGQHYQNQIDAPASVLGMAWWLCSAKDEDEANRFFDSLANHQTDGVGDARAALLKRLVTLQREKAQRKIALDQAVYLALLLRTWNAYRRGERLTNIPSNIPFPKRVY